jgi:hypothetical protein
MLTSSIAFAGNKPSFDVDWYGYFKLDASYDQNLTSHGNYVMWVEQHAVDADDEQFNMTHKQTRFGMVVEGNGYDRANVGGQLEFDLYGNGGAENTAILLLRHAYLTVESGSFQLLAGQTNDLYSPLSPSTLNYPELWNCGNPGYRRPQIRLSYTATPNDQTSFVLSGGFFRTIGNDLTPTLALATEVGDGSDDGTDAGIPSFQGLLEVNRTFSSGASLRLGVSGLFGQLKAEGTLGTEETYESQAFAGHWHLALSQQFGLAGEVFSGKNLGNYFGGILNNSTIDGVAAVGGWGYAWIQATPQVKFSAGAGMDDPDDDDLSDDSRSKNLSLFGNIQYSPIELFTLGLEVAQWETSYKNADKAKNLRLQSSFILNF